MTELLAQISTRNLWIGLLVFARMAGLFRLLPVLGGSRVPRSVRYAESVLAAVVIIPSLWYLPITVPADAFGKLLALVSEFLAGLAVGAVPAILFSALSLGGELIGRIGGFSAAATLDPELGEESGPIAALLRLAGIAVFLAAGGLERLVSAVLDLFEAFPPGSVLRFDTVVPSLAGILSQSAQLGVRLALPIFVTLLSLWIASALLSRVVPSLSILTMTMTFSGNLLVSLALLHIGFGTLLLLFQSQLPEWNKFFPTLFNQ